MKKNSKATPSTTGDSTATTTKIASKKAVATDSLVFLETSKLKLLSAPKVVSLHRCISRNMKPMPTLLKKTVNYTA
ncbi:MAG: hypothetical protein R2779_06035 [Crocinitomicaceae bacterium]